MTEHNRPAIDDLSATISGISSRSKTPPVRLPPLACLFGEARILGVTAFLVPALTAVSLIGFAVVLRIRAVNIDFVNALVLATLEAFLPLAAGIVLTTVAAKDDAIEVQLSLPTPYRNTVSRRVALILGWFIATELAATAVIARSFPSALTKSGLDSILLWLAPTLWLAAIGVTLALFLRSRATAVAILGVVWVVQLAFHGYFASYEWTRPWFLFATLYTPDAAFWQLNRLELIATAIAGLVVSWMYLRNNEWRFRGEDMSA
jgi:hypothetical protein